eukprot:4772649-Pyramimonas_sp.AAC.1
MVAAAATSMLCACAAAVCTPYMLWASCGQEGRSGGGVSAGKEWSLGRGRPQSPPSLLIPTPTGMGSRTRSTPRYKYAASCPEQVWEFAHRYREPEGAIRQHELLLPQGAYGHISGACRADATRGASQKQRRARLALETIPAHG